MYYWLLAMPFLLIPAPLFAGSLFLEQPAKGLLVLAFTHLWLLAWATAYIVRRSSYRKRERIALLSTATLATFIAWGLTMWGTALLFGVAGGDYPFMDVFVLMVWGLLLWAPATGVADMVISIKKKVPPLR